MVGLLLFSKDAGRQKPVIGFHWIIEERRVYEAVRKFKGSPVHVLLTAKGGGTFWDAPPSWKLWPRALESSLFVGRYLIFIICFQDVIAINAITPCYRRDKRECWNVCVLYLYCILDPSSPSSSPQVTEARKWASFYINRAKVFQNLRPTVQFG